MRGACPWGQEEGLNWLVIDRHFITLYRLGVWSFWEVSDDGEDREEWNLDDKRGQRSFNKLLGMLQKCSGSQFRILERIF